MLKSSILAALLLPCAVLAEGVRDVRFAVEGSQVRVIYDLAGKGEYAVELWLSRDGGQGFAERPEAVSGDIGPRVVAGPERQILWDVLDDWPAGLAGGAFVFEVRASRRRDDRRFWWLGAAGIAAGAAGVAVMASRDEGAPRGRIVLDIADPEE